MRLIFYIFLVSQLFNSIEIFAEKIKNASKISISIEEEKKNYIKAKKISLDITYEDKEIIVVNKPSGLTVHPGAGNKENTLVNGLMYKYKKNLSNMNGPFRPGIVHRIDKETSGLLVIAKNNSSHVKLSKQFSDHSIKITSSFPSIYFSFIFTFCTYCFFPFQSISLTYTRRENKYFISEIFGTNIFCILR